MAIKDYGLARSKWKQYHAFSNDPVLKKIIPETDMYSKSNLRLYLEKYQTIFLKPEEGGQGQGVIRIKKSGNFFTMEYGLKKKLYSGISILYHALSKIIGKQKYVIQQGISFITIDQRPVDFRILLYKPGKHWEVMGVMGKWAAKNKIVTNYSSGGQAITPRYALKHAKFTSKKKYTQLEDQLSLLGLYMAKHHFNYAREFGLDIGLDHSGKIWIIEGNTVPGIKLFKYHDDKTLYHKIYRHRREIRNSKI
jgi:uncharacterized circularly permuted ATP-grasp superfamily protein